MVYFYWHVLVNWHTHGGRHTFTVAVAADVDVLLTCDGAISSCHSSACKFATGPNYGFCSTLIFLLTLRYTNTNTQTLAQDSFGKLYAVFRDAAFCCFYLSLVSCIGVWMPRAACLPLPFPLFYFHKIFVVLIMSCFRNYHFKWDTLLLLLL